MDLKIMIIDHLWSVGRPSYTLRFPPCVHFWATGPNVAGQNIQNHLIKNVLNLLFTSETITISPVNNLPVITTIDRWLRIATTIVM
jgi:hypothetical protein